MAWEHSVQGLEAQDALLDAAISEKIRLPVQKLFISKLPPTSYGTIL